MITWLHITLIAVFSGLILVLLLLLNFQRSLHPKTRLQIVTWQNDIARLHQVNPHCNLDRESSTNTDHDDSKGPFFSWADHPSLVADAVENGWPRFSFTTFMSSPSFKFSSDHGDETNAEISWEVCEGSSDYMQKIRLNPGLKKIITSFNLSTGALSVIRTGLPLPGPSFGNSFFPQEPYFEITFFPGNEDIHNHLDETTGKELCTNNNSESLSCAISNHSRRVNEIEEEKPGGNQEGENETILLSVGLLGGGHLALKTPGSFPGSIGFNSSGSVYLNGRKLVLESEKNEWGIREENVIGCGYNPGQKKVFFTVNSQLAHEIHCKTEEFGYPLYPTIAANTDIMVRLNLGQTPFKFEPGNSQRTPNPCFIRPQENYSSIGFEDSKELFSMGRIDSKWWQWSATTSNNNTEVLEQFDQESLSDLFEIYLR